MRPGAHLKKWIWVKSCGVLSDVKFNFKSHKKKKKKKTIIENHYIGITFIELLNQ